jgi:poly-beta-hydroxyalkanoate depolymerase
MVGVLESFDFIFSAHFMLEILGHKMNYSSVCKEETDIFHAMSLVSLANSKCGK